MADFHQFLMIFSRNLLVLGGSGSIYKGIGRRGVGWGRWWQRLKQRSKMTQIVEFRVAMTSTCTHKGPIFYYKA